MHGKKIRLRVSLGKEEGEQRLERTEEGGA